jgi:hypothetical protein
LSIFSNRENIIKNGIKKSGRNGEQWIFYEPRVFFFVGNQRKYAIEYAQVIVDNLLGVNELDSSHIYAIGFNHARQHAYGQFFPSTPYIPGAIGVGYGTLDVYTSGSEYDMPCVGLAMYLISEITNK